MRRIVTSFLVLGFLVTTEWSTPALAQSENKKDGDKDKQPTPKVKIGKDTTYVEGPLDKDGYIDYETALNKRLGEGIKPETNANVLYMRAFGPKPESTDMPPDFYKWLGIDAPPEKGDYFLGLGSYMKNNPNIEHAEWNAILDQQGRAGARPWTGKDYPHIASWVKLNDKPLALAIEGTKRKHYFNPLVSRRPDKGPSSLISVLLPNVQKCRELAQALKCRAMLYVAEGKYDEAWQDLLACHRLARHLATGGTLIESLVGYAIEAIAAGSDLALLDNPKVTAKQLKAYLKDLEGLSPMPSLADRIDLTERFMFLDCGQMVRRSGVKKLNELINGPGGLPDDLGPEAHKALEVMDWAPALRNANRWYDRLSAAMRHEDRTEREKALNKVDEDLKELKTKALDLSDISELLKKKDADKVVGEAVSNYLVSAIMPACRKVQQASDRSVQLQRNLEVAFALAAYQRDNGKYPEKLDVLVPKYLAKVPGDLFSGKALIYNPDEKGYLLYSVGVNGIDEGGHWYDDTPRGDDPRVRMPQPELKK